MIGILKRFAGFVRPHRRYLIAAIVCMVLMDLVAYAIPIAIGYATDHVFPDIQAGGSLNQLFIVVGLLVIAGVVRGGLAHGMIRNYWGVAERVVRDLRSTLYEKLQHLDLSFYDRARTGDLMSRATYDIQLIRNFFSFGIEHRIRIIAITVTVFGFMLVQEWRLALAVYAIVPPLFFVILKYSGWMRRAVTERQKQMGRLNSRLQENITGIRVVKSFSMEENEIEKFDAENERMFNKDLSVSILQVHLNPILLMTDGVGSLVILLYGGYGVINGTMTIGVLLAFVAYLGVMRFPIMILAFNTSLMNLARGAGDRIQEILQSPDQKRHDTGTLEQPIKGRVTFDSVTFGYDEKAPVLCDLSFTIEAGERVALFGLTGAGKSTLISLIPRFYLPTHGRICIDGYNLSEWDLRHLRSEVGTVLQETFLFSATIRENIAFGKPSATMDEIRDAARHAQVHDFIETLPQGYETIVGEYGVGLSGGQKQRVAIARTLLQDPSLLILDDCTSSLDAVTERRIQDQLRELMRDRTTIIVAQRMSTLALADRIIVLQEGRVRDMDSHERLIERNPLYRSTYEAQTAFPGNPPINESNT
ncbi:MAG: ABC transporter ATP-binding protein [Spirochaetota bacterium]